jgi:hypothetical protein
VRDLGGLAASRLGKKEEGKRGCLGLYRGCAGVGEGVGFQGRCDWRAAGAVVLA